MIKSTVFIFTLAVSIVSAQLTIHEPTYSTAYTVGEDAIITWSWPGYQEGIDIISSMELQYYGGTGIDVLLTIATDVDPGLGRYVWRVPSTGVIIEEDAYDIRFSINGRPNFLSSAGLFSIRGPGGVTSSPPTTTRTSVYTPYTPSYTYPSYTYTSTSSGDDESGGGMSTEIIIGAVVGSVGGVSISPFIYYEEMYSQKIPRMIIKVRSHCCCFVYIPFLQAAPAKRSITSYKYKYRLSSSTSRRIFYCKRRTYIYRHVRPRWLSTAWTISSFPCELYHADTATVRSLQHQCSLTQS
ncbi:hypothetical protein BJV82DRAFT_617914 [Fennellomyces sp. T-0311]|nr:hypothetical protein BJV82DRAFT_617914 [Fennellomyces sp. T-0311]